MRERPASHLLAIASALALCVLAAAVLLLGVLHHGHSRTTVPSAIELIGGVPVGVQHTPVGALAAADNYVAFSSQMVEQNPSEFAALVAQAYAPAARGPALSQAQEIRGADPQNMANYNSGGHGLALIAARRLDSYTTETATVTTWLGGVVWGPRLAPRQTWNLIDTTLRWLDGRWLIVDSKTDATPAPVPSIVYVNGSNDQSAAFARLAGMTAPFYASAG
jgi:hypothetical protein